MSHTLEQFVQQWTTNSIPLRVLDPAKKEQTTAQAFRLRPSRLGRMAYITAIEYLINLHATVPYTREDDDSLFYGRMRDIFRTGHDVEARIIEVMRSAGITGFEYQVPTTMELAGFTVEGTADLVIDDTVIDIKTASASNYKRLITGYNDLTYRTQLALYAHGLGLDKAALLLYNKDTSELHLKYIQLRDELPRVLKLLELLTPLKEMTLDDGYGYIHDTFEVSEPVCQVRNKQTTGRLLVPAELRYEYIVRDVIWTTELGTDGTRYITSANPDPLNTIRTRYIK